jgi:hypothetical protein
MEQWRRQYGAPAVTALTADAQSPSGSGILAGSLELTAEKRTVAGVTGVITWLFARSGEWA